LPDTFTLLEALADDDDEAALSDLEEDEEDDDGVLDPSAVATAGDDEGSRRKERPPGDGASSRAGGVDFLKGAHKPSVASEDWTVLDECVAEGLMSTSAVAMACRLFTRHSSSCLSLRSLCLSLP